MHSLFCLVALFGLSSTQTDWVSGPGTLGPVTDFGSAFYSCDSVSYNIRGQISPVATASNLRAWVKHPIETNNRIDGHGGLYPADFDGDGDLDLSGWMSLACSMRLYRNYMAEYDSVGYASVATLAAPPGSQGKYGQTWAGDINNDGRPDIAVVCSTRVFWYENLGNFDFLLHDLGPAVHRHGGVEGADINRDGLTDLVVGDIPLEVWYQEANGTFRRQQVWAGESYKFLVGDINNDTWPDLLAEDHVFLNNAGSFPTSPTWSAGLSGPDGIWIREFNNDGRPDLLICDQWSSTPGIYWYENLGDGRSFRQHIIFRGSDAKNYGDGACAEDIDLDGKADAVGSYARVGFYRQLSPDTFSLTTIDSNFTGSHWIRTANLDYRPNGSDCDIDILASGYRQFAWWENRIVSQAAARCTLLSSILDAGVSSSWHEISWDAVRPAGTELEFFIRFGATPAQLQSRDWQGPFAVIPGCQFDTVSVAGYAAPGDQYFQYQVRMAGGTELPVLYSFAITHDAAINDIGTRAVLAPVGTLDSGITATPRAIVRNYGAVDILTPIRFCIADGYSEVITRTVIAGAESTFSFPVWTAQVCGQFSVTCSTEAPDDNPANNRAGDSILVTTRDVGVVSILAPSDMVDSGAVVAPLALVRNFGSLTQTTPVEFRTNDGYRQIVTLELSGGSDSVVAFPEWRALRRGAVSLLCSTRLADANPGNNSCRSSVTVSVRDVGVSAIYPSGDAPRGLLTPEAVVRNWGTARQPVNVRLEIPLAGYGESVSLSDGLPFEDTVISFPEWNADTGHYVSRCSIDYPTDMNQANNVFTADLVVALSVPRWVKRGSLPTGPKFKRVRDGGALSYNEDAAGDGIYALKGNSTVEFYRYDIWADRWETRESLPRLGRAGRKKAVKKGSALASANGRVFAAKGGGTLEWWEYTPGEIGGVWEQRADVPPGIKTLKEGTGAATVMIGDVPYIYLLRGAGTHEFARYNPVHDLWESMAAVPAGTSGRGFKNGSCLAASPDGDTIYALKGTYNEFFAYSVGSNSWLTRETLPRVSPPGSKKRKVRAGASMACYGDRVYALKGGNSYEFWSYLRPEARWQPAEDILPGPALKRVGGGGAMTYAPSKGNLFALKGNNTWEFYMYWLSDSIMTLPPASPGAQFAGRVLVVPQFSIAPNPFRRQAVVTYSLNETGRASLKLYSVSGELVRVIADGTQARGVYRTTIARRGLAAGVYLVRFAGDSRTLTEKVVVQ